MTASASVMRVTPPMKAPAPMSAKAPGSIQAQGEGGRNTPAGALPEGGSEEQAAAQQTQRTSVCWVYPRPTRGRQEHAGGALQQA